MVPLLHQAVELGRAKTSIELNDEGVERLMKALREMDEDGKLPGDEDEEDEELEDSEDEEFDLFPDFEDEP